MSRAQAYGFMARPACQYVPDLTGHRLDGAASGWAPRERVVAYPPTLRATATRRRSRTLIDGRTEAQQLSRE
jgi:hypothetical protein